MTNEKPEFYAILTDAGRALQFECLNSEKEFVMSEIAVGDSNGSYYEPEKTQTSLKNECYRHTVTRQMKDKKGLVKSVILDIPEDIYGFTIREVGIYSPEGELLIVGKYPASPKLTPESGAISQHAVKINLTQINELVLPVLIDPSINTASVQYVEEFFQKLEEKGQSEGYAPLDKNAKVPQEHLPNILMPFCFNSGLVDASGNAACVSITGDTLTLKAGSVGTTADGTSYTIAEDISLDISELAAGSYNLFYDAESGALEAYANKIYISSTVPEGMATNDVLLNTSIMPYSSGMKNTEGEIVPREIIPLPAKLEITSVSDGGGGATLMPKIYNENGLADYVTPEELEIYAKLTDLAKYALLASPSFTGTPTAPTAASSTNNTQIATTAFVNALLNSKIASGLFYSIGGNYLELFSSSAKNTRILLLQWGVYSASSSSDYTITLPKAFSTTNYAPIAIDTSDGSGNSHCSVTGRTTTYFSGRHSKEKYPICWIAIGK